MSKGKPRPLGILVVGDVVIDRSLVASLARPDSTSQAHAGIRPWKQLEVTRKSDILGGAATIARAVAMLAPESCVYLAGGWEVNLDPAAFVPEGFSKRITFIRAADTDFTRQIMRTYEFDEDGKPKLRERIDRDLLPDQHTYNKKDDKKWPDPSQVSAVVVSDVGTGLVKLNEVKRKLIKRYAGKPFLLRYKRKLDDEEEEVLKELPWTVLCPNRQDFANLLRLTWPLDPPAVRKIDEEPHVHPEVVKGLGILSKQFDDRSVLLKLDSEGAVLLKDRQVFAFALSESCRGTWAGIGAGDTLMASLAVSRGEGRDLESACALAVKTATAYCKDAADLERIKGWYGTTMTLEKDAAEKISLQSAVARERADGFFKVGLIDDLTSHWNTVTSYPNMLDAKRLVTQEGGWFLEDFLTVNANFGTEILRLKSAIAAYLKSDRPERPFLAALCGGPGSGKSYLVKSLGKALGCEVQSSNAAQWLSIQDLFLLCERIRTVQLQRKPALAFIDEVDSKVQGEHIYGKLLAPVWDGSYFLQTEERKLGLPVVFLVAGSDETWKDANELLGCSGAPEKLKDLVSRLSILPTNVPSLAERKSDAVYLAAFHFKKRFPTIKEIARNVLMLFAESTIPHGPRSIVQAVNLFGPLESNDAVTHRDLRVNDEALRLCFSEVLPHSWRDEKGTPIRIVP